MSTSTKISYKGIEIYHSGGQFKQTAHSYQMSNPSMWRPGTTNYEVAKERQALASEMLHSLNSSGSYTTETGLQFSASQYGAMETTAVSGPALETTKRIEAAGGNEAVFGYSGSETEAEGGGGFAALSAELEHNMEVVENVFDTIAERRDEYIAAVETAASRVSFFITSVTVI